MLDDIIEDLIYNLRIEENARQYRISKIKKYMNKKHLKVYFDVYWNIK